MTSFIKLYADPGVPLQQQFDAAVVMPTILRPELETALRSVFAQDLPGRIQILIGIDKLVGDVSWVDAICAARPPNCVVQLFYPGYSTSVRHGGLTLARDGGALRCVLSYLANSPYVAYLDDDNWWGPDHLRSLRRAVANADWAFSLRWFVHPVSRRPICVDEWECLGPDRGVYQRRFGGFVDPNCLMLNKMNCPHVLPLWTQPLSGDGKGMSADRTVFNALRRGFRFASSGQPTCFYKLDPGDVEHPDRLRRIGPVYERAGALPAGPSPVA